MYVSSLKELLLHTLSYAVFYAINGLRRLFSKASPFLIGLLTFLSAPRTSCAQEIDTIPLIDIDYALTQSYAQGEAEISISLGSFTSPINGFRSAEISIKLNAKISISCQITHDFGNHWLGSDGLLSTIIHISESDSTIKMFLWREEEIPISGYGCIGTLQVSGLSIPQGIQLSAAVDGGMIMVDNVDAFKVAPGPAERMETRSFGNFPNQEIHTYVTVTNIAGTVLKELHLEKPSDIYKVVQQLNDGLYIITVYYDGCRSVHKLLIGY